MLLRLGGMPGYSVVVPSGKLCTEKEISPSVSRLPNILFTSAAFTPPASVVAGRISCGLREPRVLGQGEAGCFGKPMRWS